MRAEKIRSVEHRSPPGVSPARFRVRLCAIQNARCQYASRHAEYLSPIQVFHFALLHEFLISGTYRILKVCHIQAAAGKLQLRWNVSELLLLFVFLGRLL
jgi:hypothetical protein